MILQSKGYDICFFLFFLFICMKKCEEKKIKIFISAAPFHFNVFIFVCEEKNTTWNKSKHRFPIKLVRHIKN